MKYLVLLGVLAACATTDDRPQNLPYITEAILAPNCAGAECHSQLRRSSGYVFDTVAHAQASLAGPADSTSRALIAPCAATPCPPGDSLLIRYITTKDSFGNRMPLDHPLENIDIDLIANWIEDGAVGYVQP
jgi:hypothetical protein